MQETPQCEGVPQPIEVYFWLKTALNTLRNEAECLTSGAHTPAPLDWPGAQGRYYSSPGRGWIPNNPEAQASRLCWGKRSKQPAAEYQELLLGFSYCPCFLCSLPPPPLYPSSSTSKQTTKSCIPFSSIVPQAYILCIYVVSLGSFPDAGLWGSRGCTFLRVWRPDAKLPSRKEVSFHPFPSLVSEAEYPVASAAQGTILLLTLPFEHQGQCSSPLQGWAEPAGAGISLSTGANTSNVPFSCWGVGFEGNSNHTLPCLAIDSESL